MASTDAWRLEGVLEREGVPTLPRLPAHAPKQPDPYPQSEAEPDLTATSFAAVADDSKVCMLRAARLAARTLTHRPTDVSLVAQPPSPAAGHRGYPRRRLCCSAPTTSRSSAMS